MALTGPLCMAQETARHQTAESMRYLGLDPDQAHRLLDIEAGLASDLAMLEAKARLAPSGVSAAVCQDAVLLQQRAAAASRRLLSAAQQARLATLEEAYSLMPVIESAQRLNLMKRQLTGPPAPLPQGSVEMDYAYVRVTPRPLPGCSAGPQTLRPGTEVLVPDSKAGTARGLTP